MNILRIALWDLRRVAKDWRAALWLLVMPLAFAFIFGSAFRDRGPQGTWIPIIDLDHSELSALFIDSMREEGYYIDVKGSGSQMDLKQRWPYGVVLPAGFSDKICAGELIKLKVVKGNGAADRILEVQARLTHSILRFTTALAQADVCHRPWNAEIRDSIKAALARPQLLTVERKTDRSLRPPPTGFQMSLPGMLVMFVFQMIVIYGGVTLLSDRTQGRFPRFIAAPISSAEVYVGKVLARILLGMLQSSLLLVCGLVLFKVQLGDHPWFLLPVILSLAIFAGSLSILAGVALKTEQQVVQMAIFTTMFLAALGGCWWPIEVVPDTFKTIAHLTPTYWAIHGLQNIMYFNKSTQVLALECPVLLIFAFGVLVPATYFARKLSSTSR